MKNELSQLFDSAIAQLQAAGVLADDIRLQYQLERSKNPEHGDQACNIAMTLAKGAGMPPRALAEKIIAAIPSNSLIRECSIAGPGFINIFLSSQAAGAIIQQVLEKGAQFGHNDKGAGRKVQVEFVSANPTGPLHVGHGRGAAVGDSLCRLLRANGWQVTAEFYYNDAGQQINNLALSTQLRCKGIGPDSDQWPEDGYRGDYITDIANAFMNKESISASDIKVNANGDANDIEAIRQFAVAYLRHEQDLDLQAFAVKFDEYYLESSLYSEGKVEETVKRLNDNGFTYEKDGALWLRTTDFGDDKDRVMRKSEGGYTYFVPDIAYHHNKWQRGFEYVINEQGADHHSTITRVRAGLQALDVGIPKGWPEYVLHQMVMVMKGGEEVKISKRAGSYVTLRDLIDEVGRDATRYFLVSRRPDAQLTFDIDLALSQSNDNPVYYIQYAHARICSLQRRLEEQSIAFELGKADLSLLVEEEEKTLIKSIAHFPELISIAGDKREPHSIATFLYQLAGEYHSYYNAHKVMIDNGALRDARVALSFAVKQVLANGLAILGVSAVEVM